MINLDEKKSKKQNKNILTQEIMRVKYREWTLQGNFYYQNYPIFRSERNKEYCLYVTVYNRGHKMVQSKSYFNKIWSDQEN